MKRLFACLTAVASLVALGPVLVADVKTRDKTVVRFEGFIGGLMNRAFGGNDGITSMVAVKGNRMARTVDNRVEIIDLAEQRVYEVDTRRREYRIRTFDEIRRQMEEARAQMAKQQMSQEDRQALEDAGKQVEFDVDVRETGQKRTLAGQETREVVLTIAMRQVGKKLEESGGLVATTTMWLAPRVPALEEQFAFQMKYFQAVFGSDFAGLNPQSANALSAFLPGIGTLAARMGEERAKLSGTPISSTMVFETVRSAEQMKQAEQNQSSGGGGIGGAIAGRLMRRNQPQPRSTMMTTTTEVLSIDTSVADADVTIPANFKLDN
jgi:hypothetical protein